MHQMVSYRIRDNFTQAMENASLYLTLYSRPYTFPPGETDISTNI